MTRLEEIKAQTNRGLCDLSAARWLISRIEELESVKIYGHKVQFYLDQANYLTGNKCKHSIPKEEEYLFCNDEEK